MDIRVLALPMHACALLLAGAACAFADDRRTSACASDGCTQSTALRADGTRAPLAEEPLRAARFGLTIDGYEVSSGKGHEEEIELFTVNWSKPAHGRAAPRLDAAQRRMASPPSADGPGTLTVTMHRQHADGLRTALAQRRVLPRIVLRIPSQDGRPRALATLHQVTIAAVRPVSSRGAGVGPADEVAFVYQRIETD